MDEISGNFSSEPYRNLAVKFKRFFELNLSVFHFILSCLGTKSFTPHENGSYLLSLACKYSTKSEVNDCDKHFNLVDLLSFDNGLDSSTSLVNTALRFLRELSKLVLRSN